MKIFREPTANGEGKHLLTERRRSSIARFKQYKLAGVFLVQLALGVLLVWGLLALPDLPRQHPVVGMEFSVFRADSSSSDGGLEWSETRMLSQLPIQTAAIERGRKLYESGKYEEAVGVWQGIAEGERGLGRAIALSNLSLCLQQLGRWEEATTAVEESASLLRSLTDDSPFERGRVLAQTLEIQGNLAFDLGQFEESVARWNEAVELYAAIDDRSGSLRSQLDGVRALQAMGLYRRAEQVLTKVSKSLREFPDSDLKAEGFQQLAYVLRLLGRLGNLPTFDADRCQGTIDRSATAPLPTSAAEAELWSLDIARQVAETRDSTQILHKETLHKAQFSLANTARAIYQSHKNLDELSEAQTAAQTALTCYQQAATSTDVATQVRAKLNLLSLSIDLVEQVQESPNFAIPNPQEQLGRLVADWDDLDSQIDALPPGRTAIYAHLDLAQSLMKVDRLQESKALLSSAVRESQTLGNPRIHSYALGYQGQLYERLQDLEKARKPTLDALLLAQSIQAGDIAYQWQWQLGRILKKQPQSDIPGAIAAYRGAVDTLKSLRRDLVAVSQDVQFDFRDRVEPVYRQYVDLLLQAENPPQENLKLAREAMEELQLAELDNFFRDACLQAKPQTLDTIDPKAVAIYNIVLDDRMEAIAQLPGTDNNLFHYRVRVPRPQRTAVLQQLRRQLQLPYAYAQIKQLSQQAYEWLIAPLEDQLKGDETLVFVLDGEWRNIPPGALYDGERYLIEKHQIALQPSFQLLDPQPLAQPIKVIAAGLENSPGWTPLPNLTVELQAIENSGVEVSQLLNGDFTQSQIEALIRSKTFGIVHLATHGQFSSRSEDTFILAADGPIDLKQLDNLLRSRDLRQAKSIDLLVMTACQTAEGDDRAILGLAGVAVRVGARSTLASLWSLQHESVSDFIALFYQNLTQGVSRAEALRQAQLSFLADKNYRDAPLYWAPYVLVGDWQ